MWLRQKKIDGQTTPIVVRNFRDAQGKSRQQQISFYGLSTDGLRRLLKRPGVTFDDIRQLKSDLKEDQESQRPPFVGRAPSVTATGILDSAQGKMATLFFKSDTWNDATRARVKAVLDRAESWIDDLKKRL
jgi:hypothetical protein